MRGVPQRAWSGAALAAGMAVLLLASQCLLVPDENYEGSVLPNRRPTARVVTGVVQDSIPTTAIVRFRWTGSDPDGVVRWFEWAVDDTVSETAWHRSARFDATIPFAAREPVGGEQSASWHTFFLRAVDNQGYRSRPDARYFNAHTIAPSSWIVAPRPQSQLASALRISWTGDDPDATYDDHLPAWFEYKLMRLEEPATLEAIEAALAESLNVFLRDLDPGNYPDVSLGDYYDQAVRAWVRVPGHGTNQALIQNLEIGARYCFVVRAIDEAGAVEPSLDPQRNYMAFRVGNERIRVTICEPMIGCQTFSSGSYADVWKVTVAPDQPFRLQWTGDASQTGSEAGASNYAFDISDPLDDSLRDTNGWGGWIGWGMWDGTREAISFPHSDAGKTHLFHLKMRDMTNLTETETRCVVEIYVANLSFSRKFLIVDDLYGAPKPCLGSPPGDALTDEFRLEIFGDALADLLPPNQQWSEFSMFGSEEFGEAVKLPDEFLEVIGTFQNTIWDCGSAQPTGLLESLGKRFLSRYIEAGGNLFLLCDQGPITQLIGFQHVDPEPICPGAHGPHNYWYAGTGFLWQQLHLRGCVDKPRDRTGSALIMAPETMVRAESLDPLYPDLVLSPERWRCGSTARGIVRFEGLRHNLHEPAADPWYRREEAAGGCDLLYQSHTLEPGSPTDSLPVAWRSPAAWADTLTGYREGRVVTFAFHPYFFDQANVRTTMNYLLNWLVTGHE